MDVWYPVLRKITSSAIQLAIANKHTWWPKGITNEQIRDNLATLFSEQKLKTSGDGYWPAQMKVKIPMDAVTGEVKSCDIKNSDNSDLALTDLPGSKWDTMVVELAGFYFSGKYTWGIIKQLFKLKLSYASKLEMDPKKISFLPKKIFAGEKPLVEPVSLETPTLELFAEPVVLEQ